MITGRANDFAMVEVETTGMLPPHLRGLIPLTFPDRPLHPYVSKIDVPRPTIFFDLDGVLADFDKRAEKVIGVPNTYKFEYVYGPEKFWEAAHSDPYFFKNMEVMPGAYRMVAATVSYHCAVLTALPKTNPERTAKQKREWVETHFPGYPLSVITCRTTEKPNYCKPGDVLIDDRAVNKDKWEERGGRCIVHTDAQSTLEQLKSMGFAV